MLRSSWVGALVAILACTAPGWGQVLQPESFVMVREEGKPAVKCRGREYLRIIYGPDYTTEENLSRLRSRGLGHRRDYRRFHGRKDRRRFGLVDDKVVRIQRRRWNRRDRGRR